VYAPVPTPTPSGQPPGRDAVRNARYAYLVVRLQSRQMTMEEATELFTIMQAMLQTSEAARAALVRAASPPQPVIPGQTPPAPRTPPSPPSGTSDDLFLVGLLAMGAGAGLLAALSKRIQDGSPPSSGGASATSGANSTSPKG